MSIKELALESARGINESPHGGYTRGFVEGANAVLKEIEELANTGNWRAFPMRNITELRSKIKELKGE